MKKEYVIAVFIFITALAAGLLLGRTAIENADSDIDDTVFTATTTPVSYEEHVEKKYNLEDINPETPAPTSTFALPRNIPKFSNSEYEISDNHLILSGHYTVPNAVISLNFSEYYGKDYVTKSDADGKWTANINLDVLNEATQTVTLSTPRPGGQSYETIDTEIDIEVPVSLRSTSTILIDWYEGGPLEAEPVAIGPLPIVEFFAKWNPYLAGTVITGEFKNYLVFYSFRSFGLCYSFCGVSYFLVDTDYRTLVAIDDYNEFSPYGFSEQSGYWMNHSESFKNREEVILPPEMTLPETLTLQNSTYVLEKIYESGIFDSSIATNTPVIDHTDTGLPIYFDIAAGRIYVPLPDGRAVRYMYEIPFMVDGQVPNVSWFDGSANTAGYVTKDTRGGCGGSLNDISVRSDISPEDLDSDSYLWSGVATTGEKMYTIANPSDPRLTDLHERYGWVGYGENRHEIGYEGFIASRPLVYWVTPHDMVVEMRRVDYRPLAECGKPVVYLYPETEQDTSVFVDLQGPMTVSEPPHGKFGWKVTARTDGYVVDLEDGQVYPNLYWEGFGVNYEVPDEGFVIAQSDIDVWLPETLNEIGFTQRERDEFLEFWLPRLPKTPYVFFTFVDQKYFDRDAALMIDPKPDSVSRVFMEYRPLMKHYDAEPLVLPKIKRDGFTVVEWGGALYH